MEKKTGPTHSSNPTFAGYSAKQAIEFTNLWLPAWTGNNPEKLASFYTDDAFYSDPGIPLGITGKPALLAYFKDLLSKNPNWVWTHARSTPVENGFLNFWHADIPLVTKTGKSKTISCDGLCVVQLRDGLIYRNEVFFDRSEILKTFVGQ